MKNTKHETKDPKRNKSGWKASRRDARRNKAKRRAFETGTKHR